MYVQIPPKSTTTSQHSTASPFTLGVPILEAVLAAKERAEPIIHKSQAKGTRKPDLTIKQILHWADTYHARSDKWPGQGSGLIVESSNDTWLGVNQSFVNGRRGLSGAESLATVLERERGARRRIRFRRLSEEDFDEM